MAGERDIIAASNQGNSSMTSQEIADMESIMGSRSGWSNRYFWRSWKIMKAKLMKVAKVNLLMRCLRKKFLDCLVVLIKMVQVKIRLQDSFEFLQIKEDDSNIRNEIWKQYLKHMGIGQSAIDECLSK